MTLIVRDMQSADAPECTRILNAIIALGGSTAYEEPYDVADFEAHYLHETAVCLVAEAEGTIVGFQGCFEVGPGIYSIGSFTDRENRVPGAGRALFEGTLKAARAKGATAILAKITSDNKGGLAFYSKMGFQEVSVIKGDHRRKGGTIVDRVIKRFDL